MAQMEQKNGEEPLLINRGPLVNVPLLYSNGVLVGLTLTEVILTPTMNGKPVCQVVLPLPTSKSLIETLKLAIEDYHRKFGIDIPTLEELIRRSEENENVS